MIMLTRLSGSVFALNPDLIERIDTTPDTVVTLVDGKKYVVTDTLEEIVGAVRRHRGEILALSTLLDVSTDTAPAPRGRLPEQPVANVTPLLRTDA